MLYENMGAPWRRPDGTIIERGTVFTPTDAEMQRKAYKLRPVGATRGGTETPAAPVVVPEPVLPASAGEAAPSAGQSQPDDAAPAWPMVIEPELYLRLYPNGPKAALARQVLGLKDDADATD